MELKAGTKLKSATCTTEAMVVKAPAGDLDLRCGGEPMLLPDQADLAGTKELDPAFSTGTQLGKRYATASGDLEILVTKAGGGTISLAGEPLPIKTAKALPASD